VRYELGVNPDVGRDRVSVVPQLPQGQDAMAVRDLKLGTGAIGVDAERVSTLQGTTLTTTVSRARYLKLTIGAVTPTGSTVSAVRLDGKRTPYDVVRTYRGREVRVPVGRARGPVELTVRYTF
jgi:hypothetical protein